ncbi:hypothetical protein BKA58DRAFT_397533 [Alternaria rosae]|uniref:uncharacterized protein n=1 Tax=Alternaria rosae TaxID=1187941 RepID=UPI001E8ED7C5|nr:uncharacterized protein BKA58DRAFT_397533 [Alternaria rosae]KAH6883334.1 hypothetical protein BKA58DRAFT_397533 [Alternaria rosae]
MRWYENSARVPMIINRPNIAPKKVKESVSTMDLLPTFVDLAEDNAPSLTALAGTVAARADTTQVVRQRRPIATLSVPEIARYSTNFPQFPHMDVTRRTAARAASRRSPGAIPSMGRPTTAWVTTSSAAIDYQTALRLCRTHRRFGCQRVHRDLEVWEHCVGGRRVKKIPAIADDLANLTDPDTRAFH